MRLLTVIFLAFLFSSCAGPGSGPFQTDKSSGQPYIPYVTDQIVIDESKVLNDGAGLSWKLEPGNYKLEMTANNDGADIEWIGGGCPKTQPMRQATMTCGMSGPGQLIITNPTVWGLGKQVSITVRVTKLAR